MISGVGLFAILGILAGIATLVLRTLRAPATVMEQRGTILFSGVSSGALQTAANLCLGFSCLFALAACGELWLSLQGQESQVGISASSAWGALWVYVLALLLEWRRLGLSGAGRRALSGWLLAGVGVLFLGISLGAWSSIHPVMDTACADGIRAIDATATKVGAVTALGLALVPLAGIALQGTVPKVPPLTTAAASVVLATWMQPVLPVVAAVARRRCRFSPAARSGTVGSRVVGSPRAEVGGGWIVGLFRVERGRLCPSGHPLRKRDSCAEGVDWVLAKCDLPCRGVCRA